MLRCTFGPLINGLSPPERRGPSARPSSRKARPHAASLRTTPSCVDQRTDHVNRCRPIASTLYVRRLRNGSAEELLEDRVVRSYVYKEGQGHNNAQGPFDQGQEHELARHRECGGK